MKKVQAKHLEKEDGYVSLGHYCYMPLVLAAKGHTSTDRCRIVSLKIRSSTIPDAAQCKYTLYNNHSAIRKRMLG